MRYLRSGSSYKLCEELNLTGEAELPQNLNPWSGELLYTLSYPSTFAG